MLKRKICKLGVKYGLLEGYRHMLVRLRYESFAMGRALMFQGIFDAGEYGYHYNQLGRMKNAS